MKLHALTPSHRRRHPWATLALLTVATGALSLWGCGPKGQYTRFVDNPDADASPPDATTPDVIGSGGRGTGGSAIGTGGLSGSGGSSSSGGATSTGGTTGTGGTTRGGSGGAAAGTGGSSGTGSQPGGTGGAGTGGAPIGGAPGTGGSTGAAGSSGPRIISIDFSGTVTPMTATEIAGVKPASHWNDAPDSSGSVTNLVDKDGAATSAALSWACGGGVYQLTWTDAPGDTRMMRGYLDPVAASTPATVSVTGLPAAFSTMRYDVYVYTYGSFSSGTRHADYAIGSSGVSITQTGPSATKFNGYDEAPDGGSGNYVVFRGVSGTSFTLKATPGPASGSQSRSPVNGIQIVTPSGS